MSTFTADTSRKKYDTKLSNPCVLRRFNDEGWAGGISLNDAIVQARQINEQSKAAGFYQEALDHVAKQGFVNARFEVNAEEDLDVAEEFYIEGDPIGEVKQLSHTYKNSNQEDGFAIDIQKALQQSVQAMN